jgi:hypothetical protein
MQEIQDTPFAGTVSPVNDQTETQIAQQILPFAQPAVSSALTRQVQGDVMNLETSLNATRQYIQERQQELGQLDLSTDEGFNAARALENEIQRTLLGRNQNRLTTSGAQARINSTVRRLSTQFPTAARDLQGFLSTGSRSVFSSAGSSALAQQEELAAKREEILSDAMARIGWDYNNPRLREAYQNEVSRAFLAQQEKTILDAELARVRLANENIQFDRNQLGLSRDNARALEERARGVLHTQVFAGITTTLQRFKTLGGGQFQNPMEVKGAIREQIQALRSEYTDKWAGLAGVDLDGTMSMINDLEKRAIAMVDDGSALEWSNYMNELATSRFKGELMDAGMQMMILSEVYPSEVVQDYITLAATGNDQQVARLNELLQIGDIQGAWQRSRRYRTGNATLEDSRSVVELSNIGRGQTWDTTSQQVRDSFEMIASEGLHDHVFLSGTGAKVPDSTGLPERSYNNTLARLSTTPEITQALREGDIAYDRASKTLVVLDAEGRGIHQYRVKSSNPDADRRAERASQRFLSQFTFLPDRSEMSPRVAPDDPRFFNPFSPTARTTIADRHLYALANNIELGYSRNLLPTDGIEGYKSILRGVQ